MKINGSRITPIEYKKETSIDKIEEKNIVKEESTDPKIYPSAETMKAYIGIEEKNEHVSADEVTNYLECTGFKNKDLYPKFIELLCDETQKISKPAFELLKSLQEKGYFIIELDSLFSELKVNNKFNKDILKLVDDTTLSTNMYADYVIYKYITNLKQLKNKNGEFDKNAINLVLKYPDVFKYWMTVGIDSFKPLKNKNDEFDYKIIEYIDNILAKHSNDPTMQKSELHKAFKLIKESKDENGNFNLELGVFNQKLKNDFPNDFILMQSVAKSFPPEKEQKRDEFLDYIKTESSKHGDRDFVFKALQIIANDKKNEESNIGLDYSQDSIELIKSLVGKNYYSINTVENIIQEFNRPIYEYNEEIIEAFHNLAASYIQPREVKIFIDGATRKSGENKGEFSVENLKKYHKIYQENYGNQSLPIIEELVKLLALEEDDKALDIFTRLYTLKWEKDIGGHFGKINETIDKNTLSFILQLLTNSKNKEPQRPCLRTRLESIEKLFNMRLPMSSKEAFENFLFMQEIDVIEKLEKINFEELGINTGEITNAIFKNATEEELLTFKEYLKDYLKDKSVKNIHIELNNNCYDIVELTTGYPQKERLLYNLKKGKPVSEASDYRWDSVFYRKEKNYESNTKSDLRYRVRRGYFSDDKVLEVQTFEQYDKDWKLIYKESTSQSGIPGLYNVTRELADGTVETLSTAYRNEFGNDVVKKNLTSSNGTQTNYYYEDDPQGNRIMDYKITSPNGDTLMDLSVTFEVLSESHFISSRNNKKFDIKLNENILFVTNLSTNETVEIEIDNFTKNTKDLILPVLKTIPGEELFEMKKLDLKGLSYDPKTRNASYNKKTEEICANKDYIELSVILHEWGHAKDSLKFKEISEEICKDSKLNEIYEREKNAFRQSVSDSQLTHVGYFISDFHYLGNEKIKEGIAETNTVLTACPKNETQSIRSHYWMQHFPETIAYLSKLLF